jgi:hypothetical protein
MFVIDHNQLIAPLKETKYIIISSFLFFCPSLYAFQKEAYLLSGSLFIAATMSINHWRHPTYSWRRITDHIAAKVAFIICFVNGFFIYPSFFIQKIGGFCAFLYCYYMSDKYCNKNIHINEMNPCWWKYHFAFHLFCVVTQMLIVKSI